MKIRLFLIVFCSLFVLFPLSGAYKQGKILLDCRFTPKEVSADDLRRYERLRRELTGSRQKACNRIGFLTAGAER